MPRKTYVLEHLGCAHCAAKMEERIARLDGVEDVAIVFATKQLRLNAADPDALLPQIQQIANSLEPDVTIHEYHRNTRTAAAVVNHGHPHHTHGEADSCEHHHAHNHHHEHGETCSCGHDHTHKHHHEHGETCSCGHDHTHEHHHEHGETCSCGHPHAHEHHHEHGEACSCGHPHTHEHEEHASSRPHLSAPDSVTRVYTLEQLGCAHCAAKMEHEINELEAVDWATITFATKQLRVSAKDPDALLDEMRSICSKIEPDVRILAPEQQSAPRTEETSDRRPLLQLIAGAVLFLAGCLVPNEIASFVLLVAAYLILGAKVLVTAVKNISHGQVFDENFLMSIATLGAFAIQDYPEAVGVMLFYRVGDWFEERAVARSRSQIMETIGLHADIVHLADGGECAPEEVQVGDRILIRPGDRIPLDGVVVDGDSRIDTAPITGEPVPVRVTTGAEVLSGCINTNGTLILRVTQPLAQSTVTRILDSVENAAASKPKIDRFITRFSRVYTPFVVALAVLTAIVPSIFTGDWHHWIYTAITFLVISCPCALVLSVPLSFFSGIGAGSKLGILFKGGVSLEALSVVKIAVMDKTGTVTEGSFTVQRILPHGMEENELLSLCAAAESQSTHPIAQSIVSAAVDRGLFPPTAHHIEETAGHGVRAELPQGTFLCGTAKFLSENGVDLSSYDASHAGTEVLCAQNGRFAGQIVIDDTVKPDAADSIRKLHALGIRTAMLTGDTEANAQRIAEQTGIGQVYAKLLPQDKLERLRSLRENGSVLFVGDGINDAPVLAGADVGAAMGSGADAALEAADIVFMTNSMRGVPQSIAIARATRRIAWQNVVFALIIKALVMVLGLAGIANMWMAVFADTGVAMICVLNSIRILYKKF